MVLSCSLKCTFIRSILLTFLFTILQAATYGFDPPKSHHIAFIDPPGISAIGIFDINLSASINVLKWRSNTD